MRFGTSICLLGVTYTLVSFGSVVMPSAIDSSPDLLSLRFCWLAYRCFTSTMPIPTEHLFWPGTPAVGAIVDINCVLLVAASLIP
jgi:hypothetical protein